jgi:hypothetical protein
MDPAKCYLVLQQYNKAGLAYVLGITSIHKNKFVWMNGPFPTGTNDIQMFRKEGGLKSQIPASKSGRQGKVQG